jgi:hypothetical protein
MIRNFAGEFLAAMHAAGISPTESIADRLFQGYTSFGIKTSNGVRRVEAHLSLGGIPSGWVGPGSLLRWQAGDVFDAEKVAEALEHDRALKRASALQKAAQATIIEDMAKAAADMWEDASAVDPAHPYIAQHDMTGEGLRQKGDLLLVAMSDLGGKLSNLMSIDGKGRKRFVFKEGQRRRLLWLCGQPGDTLYMGANIAILAAVRRATGQQIAYAVDRASVYLEMRKALPDLEIVVCPTAYSPIRMPAPATDQMHKRASFFAKFGLAAGPVTDVGATSS